MADAIVHFEIHVDDVERAKKFYTEVFGWQIDSANIPGTDYWLVKTGRGKGQDGGQVGIDGGLVRRSGPAPSGNSAPNGFVVTIQVDDVEATHKQALDDGATDTTGKMDIPGVGLWYGLKDPDGNHIGILQPPAA